MKYFMQGITQGLKKLSSDCRTKASIIIPILQMTIPRFTEGTWLAQDPTKNQ